MRLSYFSLKALRVIPLICVLLLAGCQSQTMTATDKAHLLRVSTLQNYGMNIKSDEFAQYEKFEKTGYYDSTYDLDYTVETPDKASEALFMNQTLSVHDSPTEATTVIATTRGTSILGMKTEKVSEKPVANETIYGDGSKLTILVTEDGKNIGNLFTARKGKRSYFLVISGIYFDTKANWDDFAGKNINDWLDGTDG